MVTRRSASRLISNNRIQISPFGLGKYVEPRKKNPLVNIIFNRTCKSTKLQFPLHRFVEGGEKERERGGRGKPNGYFVSELNTMFPIPRVIIQFRGFSYFISDIFHCYIYNSITRWNFDEKQVGDIRLLNIVGKRY